MTEDQYIALQNLTYSFINADKTTGKEIKFEDIESYIEKSTMFFPGLCNDDVKKRLFTDIEYQFKITHAKGNVIFDKYDQKRDWYSNDDVKNPYYWSRYKKLLLANPSLIFEALIFLMKTHCPTS